MTHLKPVDAAIIGGGWTALLRAKEIRAKTSPSGAVFERGIPRKIDDYAATMERAVPNLFVVGASAFPQNAAPNPTLTVGALTYMTVGALIERYGMHLEKLI